MRPHVFDQVGGTIGWILNHHLEDGGIDRHRVSADIAQAAASLAALSAQQLRDPDAEAVGIPQRSLGARPVSADIGFIRFQASLPGLADHPLERIVRDAVRIVTAADVGVHTGEPSLLERLARLGLPPDLRPEIPTLFVDRHRLTGDFHDSGRSRSDVKGVPVARGGNVGLAAVRCQP